MRAFTERRPKVIGAVAVTLLAVLVTLVVLLNRSLFQSGYGISARFANAAGVAAGTPVLLAGVHVGTVTSVAISGDAVVARMRIDDGVVLPQRTAADIEVETLLGVVDVTLRPLAGWGRPLHQGAVLDDTSVPTEFYQLDNVAGHLLERSNAKAFGTMVKDLAAITKGKERQVAQIVGGLGKLLSTVSGRSAEVRQLVNSANTLAATLAQHDQQLSGAIGSLGTVAAGLAGHSTQLSALIDNLQAMAAQTNGLLASDRPQIDALIGNLTSTLGVVSHHQDDLAQAVSYLAGAIKGFASIGYSGSTPLTWSNIYVSTTGITGTAGVLGACGPLTTALDDALGPTPLPCATRTTPLHATGPAVPGATTATSPGGRSGAQGLAPGGAGTGAAASPAAGIGGLAQLFAPLAGGVRP